MRVIFIFGKQYYLADNERVLLAGLICVLGFNIGIVFTRIII